MSPPVPEQGVWPGCGHGASRWVGLTYKVNSLWFLLVSSCPTTSKDQVKKHDKVLHPGLLSPLSFCHADVDECETDLNNCHENAQCANTEGSFTCTCKPGYTGDGTKCTSKIS